jgi:hypothetical protein
MEASSRRTKTERIGRKVYRTRDAARADVFDYMESFYNTIRRDSTIGYLSSVEFERKVGLYMRLTNVRPRCSKLIQKTPIFRSGLESAANRTLGLSRFPTLSCYTFARAQTVS